MLNDKLFYLLFRLCSNLSFGRFLYFFRVRAHTHTLSSLRYFPIQPVSSRPLNMIFLLLFSALNECRQKTFSFTPHVHMRCGSYENCLHRKKTHNWEIWQNTDLIFIIWLRMCECVCVIYINQKHDEDERKRTDNENSGHCIHHSHILESTEFESRRFFCFIAAISFGVNKRMKFQLSNDVVHSCSNFVNWHLHSTTFSLLFVSLVVNEWAHNLFNFCARWHCWAMTSIDYD